MNFTFLISGPGKVKINKILKKKIVEILLLFIWNKYAIFVFDNPVFLHTLDILKFKQEVFNKFNIITIFFLCYRTKNVWDNESESRVHFTGRNPDKCLYLSQLSCKYSS